MVKHYFKKILFSAINDDDCSDEDTEVEEPDDEDSEDAELPRPDDELAGHDSEKRKKIQEVRTNVKKLLEGIDWHSRERAPVSFFLSSCFIC